MGNLQIIPLISWFERAPARNIQTDDRGEEKTVVGNPKEARSPENARHSNHAYLAHKVGFTMKEGQRVEQKTVGVK